MTKRKDDSVRPHDRLLDDLMWISNGPFGDCLSPDDIQKFLSGKLSRKVANRVDKHLVSCRECVRRVDELVAAVRGTAPTGRSMAWTMAAQGSSSAGRSVMPISAIRLSRGTVSVRGAPFQSTR